MNGVVDGLCICVAVAYAQLLYPAEARLAMEIADVHSTSTYTGLMGSRGSSGNLREVDLNETPSIQKKKLQARLQALIKTGTVNLSETYAFECVCVRLYTRVGGDLAI